MFYKLRALKNIAIVLLIVFSITFALPVNIVNAANQLSNSQPISVSNNLNDKIISTLPSNNLNGQLQKNFQKLEQYINYSDKTQFQNSVVENRQIIHTLKKQMLDELDNNQAILEQLNAGTALERNRKFRQNLEKQCNDLNLQFEDLESLAGAKSSDPKILRAKLKKIKETISPEPPQPALGNDLPHRNIELNPPQPATGGEISAAYSAVPGETRSSGLPVQPAPQDLQEGPETKFTEAIETAAAMLGDNPLRIYEYVRNTIDFEPYYGSRKGATGTLETKAGNDMDQASLLIALLRKNNIPARYVTGTVEIPSDKAMNWVGARTPEAAARILASGGTPVTTVVSGGNITALRLQHTWAEAYVPYENYRAQAPGKGPKTWVPLDPSFKQYEITAGLNIEQISGLNVQSIIDQIRNTGEISPDKMAISNMNPGNIETGINHSIENLENYITDNNLSQSEVFGGKKIIAEYLHIIPASLPVKTIAITDEYAVMPQSQMEKIGFTISGANPYGLSVSGSLQFNYHALAPELYGKKITLSWQPATSEDEAVINQYGGLFNTPAYLVELIPQLRIDGTVVASGEPVGLAYHQEFTMIFSSARGNSEKVANPVTAGNFYAVGLNYQQIARTELTDIADKLEEVAAGSNPDIYTDEIMGEILNATAKTYFMQVDQVSRITAQAYNVHANRMISEAITAYNGKVEYLFQSPVSFKEGGMIIDVDRDCWNVVSTEGNKQDEKAFMIATGMTASAMEHGIWEQFLEQEAVSTVKVLMKANEAGIPIFTVSSKNIDQVLPQLQVSEYVKTDIQNAVNKGHIVTIPKNNITINDWNGIGYVVLDPATGAAAYMISGGMAGGATTAIIALAAIAAAIIAIVDVVFAAGVVVTLSACAIGALAAAWIFSMVVLALVSVLDDILNHYVYHTEDNSEAFISDAIWALATLGALKCIKVLFETLKFLAKEGRAIYRAKNQLINRGVSRELIEDVETQYGEPGLTKLADALDNGATLLRYRPSSEAILVTTPGKTTTVLGNYGTDMKFIIAELDLPKSTDFGPKPNGFNVLNVDVPYNYPPDQFWVEYNKPFLDEAISRSDEIILATIPEGRVLEVNGVKTGFGREYAYLTDQGYHYDAISKKMIKN